MRGIMGKKIGVMTFHRAINYGALMQGYALVEKLKDCGANSSMIYYKCPFIENAYRLTWGLNKKTITGYTTWIKSIPDQIRKKKRFRKFMKKHLTLSKGYNKDNISKCEKEFDGFVTGSDQVWNMQVCGNDKNYMLDFSKDNSKKYSYAASIGGYVLSEDEIEIAKSFNKISMREKSASDYIANATGKEVHTDLDPTLLLTKEQWERVICKKRVIKKPYIFIYSVHPQNRMVEYAYKLAKEKGLEIYHLHNRVKKDLKEDNVHLIFDSSPEQFLSLIHDAEYVITNSFHGTVFSIIFQKQFLSELETKGGFNNRVWELLCKLEIKRRILDRVPGINDGIVIDEEIDWNTVDINMKKEREKSVEYLNSIVN